MLDSPSGGRVHITSIPLGLCTAAMLKLAPKAHSINDHYYRGSIFFFFCIVWCRSGWYNDTSVLPTLLLILKWVEFKDFDVVASSSPLL